MCFGSFVVYNAWLMQLAVSIDKQIKQTAWGDYVYPPFLTFKSTEFQMTFGLNFYLLLDIQQ
jgi:hypothetical protein